MASYIQGVTDYIPQLQPFQPDYNFLGNVLQTRQSRYEASHKQLNKMYGTLLYSPMLRGDNIQQRDQFFKMIDQDIKKMSGMDLSLQQNSDAAGGVFKSLYDNKSIVKDMTYTKQYKTQLDTAENYRNCLDQEKCGGSYWDVGVNALHYRADEFKKASADDAMGMQAPSYSPFINITEKALKYVGELKKQGFGITTVGWSPDGRYIVTTKDGKNLELPLQQLFKNQYGADPKIQDMYKTMAYVQRKNYVQNNLEKFNGDEAAAEDEYINAINTKVDEYKQQAITSMKDASTSQDVKTALEQKIKKDGTTGSDTLAEAWRLQNVNYQEKIKNAMFDDETAKTASAIQTNSENRSAKTNYTDALIARVLMENDFKETAINIANLTGEQKVEADPYAKSYYDHSLSVSRMAQQHKYSMEESLYKTKLDIIKDQLKQQGEAQARGPANTALNSGKFVEGVAGTSADTEKTDEALESFAYVQEQSTNSVTLAKDYVQKSTANYLNIIGNDDYTQEEQTVAKKALKSIYKNKYNADLNTFESNGASVEYSAVINESPIDSYNNALGARKEMTNDAMYSRFFENTLDPITANYNNSKQLQDITSDVFRKNNQNVKSFALTSGVLDEDEKSSFELLFNNKGDLRSKAEYALILRGNMDADDAGDLYDEMYVKYNYTYNSGSSTGTDKTDPSKKLPLVKAIYDGSKSFGMFAEGKSSGGGVQYAFDASAPAAFGTRGLLTFADDGLISKNTLFSSAIVAEEDDIDESNGFYMQAINSITTDIKTGAFNSKDKDRPFGTVTYLDLALSDPKYKAIHIDFAPSYMKKYEGTDNDPGWGSDSGIKSNGVTMYVPKTDLNNDFTESFKMQPYDIILNHKPVTINKPNAGSITVNRMEDGRYNVTGSLYDYSTGTRVPKPAQKILSADVGGQNLVMGYQALLDQVEIANANFLDNQRPNLIFDPATLTPESIFNQSSNAPDPINIDQMMMQ